jgi:glycosyltransferase involved in cell wall biosynthesis
MRIAFDARPFEPGRTGVGRYLEGLFGQWTVLFPEDRLVALSSRPVHLPGNLEGRVTVPFSPTGLPGTLWLQTAAPWQAANAGADLFFGTLGIIPLLGGVPAVATIHDLTPILFPAWHSAKNRLGFAPFLGATVRKARRLVTVSDATRRDLVARYPQAAAKCRVVHNGFTPFPELEGDEPLSSQPYVLFLGTVEPRKNVERLVEAMESIWDRRPTFPRLVIAGGDGWGLPGFAQRLAASRHAARIRRTGYVKPAEAARLIRRARLVAYPSLYEGFGLPALEAMALGTVVVASSASSLPEVVGDAGLLPDPTKVEEIAAAVERAQDDEPFRERARRLGLERARGFTWDRAARETRAVFEQALA